MEVQRSLLLLLLHESDGRIRGRTRVQNFAFLTKQRYDEECDTTDDPLEFDVYDDDLFTTSLLDWIEKLDEEGLVEVDTTPTYSGTKRYDHELTWEGRKESERAREVAPDALVDAVEGVIEEFGDMPASALIDHVYEEYPHHRGKTHY